MGGDEEAWLALGRASQILDNLIAAGKAKPMIVVMTNGNVSQEAAPVSLLWVILCLPCNYLKRWMDQWKKVSDIVNFIDATYRTVKRKSGRAIAGLSMGGFHSLHISKQYPICLIM